MAKNAAAEEPREVTPEQLTPAEPLVAGTLVGEPAARKSRKGIVIGGSIAAGVLALGLSFGGGYALGHSQGGAPDFSQMSQNGGFGPGGSGQDGDRPEPPSGGFPGQGQSGTNSDSSGSNGSSSNGTSLNGTSPSKS